MLPSGGLTKVRDPGQTALQAHFAARDLRRTDSILREGDQNVHPLMQLVLQSACQERFLLHGLKLGLYLPIVTLMIHQHSQKILLLYSYYSCLFELTNSIAPIQYSF